MALDYTISYAGLTIGNGTAFPIMHADGLEDLPPLRTGDLSIGQRDGETPGIDLAAGRDITVDLIVFDTSPALADYFTNIERLKAATVPSVEQVFTYQVPGRLPRSLMARCRARSIPVSQDYQFRYGASSLAFHATDPRIYDAAFTSPSVGLPSASGGLTFNATANFVFGTAGTGGSLVASNLGNYPAPWVAQIFGPVVNPSITLAASGMTVNFSGTINAGDVLTIDSLARSVLLNGTASRYSLVVSPTQWFALPVGNSTIQFNAASGTGTLTFNYRSVWM